MIFEIQNNDGICRLVAPPYEVILPPGEQLIVETSDIGIKLKIKGDEE